MYFSIVVVTNAIDVLGEFGALHWTFLNSGNFDFMRSIVEIYDVGAVPTKLLLMGAFAVELAGAALFWRALLKPTTRRALQAVCWSVLVWIAFILHDGALRGLYVGVAVPRAADAGHRQRPGDRPDPRGRGPMGVHHALREPAVGDPLVVVST